VIVGGPRDVTETDSAVDTSVRAQKSIYINSKVRLSLKSGISLKPLKNKHIYNQKLYY